MTTLRSCAVSIFVGSSALLVGIGQLTAQAASSLPLQLEAKIPLGDVRGRIDHMAIDPARQRLFVAELGNDTVAVVDLARFAVARQIRLESTPSLVAADQRRRQKAIAKLNKRGN